MTVIFCMDCHIVHCASCATSNINAGEGSFFLKKFWSSVITLQSFHHSSGEMMGQLNFQVIGLSCFRSRTERCGECRWRFTCWWQQCAVKGGGCYVMWLWKTHGFAVTVQSVACASLSKLHCTCPTEFYDLLLSFTLSYKLTYSCQFWCQ